MKLLLDTHTFLWMDSDPSRLSLTATTLIADSSNEIYLSVVSLWEMTIKSGLGKLTLRVPLNQMVAENERVNSLRVLAILPEHVYQLNQLPHVHNDPFDRLLIGVAQCEAATLLSVDVIFQRYPVALVW